MKSKYETIYLVKELKTTYLNTRASGLKLSKTLRIKLDNFPRIIYRLNFSGSELITYEFLRYSIGELLKYYSRFDISDRLRFTGITQMDLILLNDAIDDSEKYFKLRNEIK